MNSIKMLKFLLITLFSTQIQGWVKEMENKGIFQGDMMLTPKQMQQLKEGKLAFGSNKDGMWPQTIPYEFESDIANEPGAIKAIDAAIQDYHKYTCLRFVKRTTERTYMSFFIGGGCWSYVGMSDGRNRVSMGRGCWSRSTAIHEIGHSLGFWHEQSRPDRDTYLRIHFENIPDDIEYNFDKVNTIDSRGTAYDYFSVMHYGKTAFGQNGALTMETTDQYYQDLIGTGMTFSHMDITQINMVYKCPVYNGQLPLEPTPECHDFSSYCEMYKWWGRCKENVYKRDCPISCGMCTPGKPRTQPPTAPPTPPPCQDLATYCTRIQDRCSEDGAKDWMKVNCKKTCGYCGGGPKPSQCKDNWHNCLSSQDRCHEDWFKNNCKKTCNWCNGGTGPQCKDLWDQCQTYQARCTEAAVQQWMTKNCEKTCGQCN